MFSLSTWLSVLVVALGAARGTVPTDERINLVDFGRVVHHTGSGEKIVAKDLDRGPDGWEAQKGREEQFSIGVEWDAPRDICEINIEFRHAIADRDRLQVQYFQPDEPARAASGAAGAVRGKWVTAKTEWWAGDRDVTFAFVAQREEQGGSGGDQKYRRTQRIRFLLGDRDLPPVRYIRAWGPQPSAVASFNVILNPGSKIKPPLEVSVKDGYLLHEPTTRPTDDISTSERFAEAPATLHVRYVQPAAGDVNKTVVTVRDANEETRSFTFQPAEVVRHGQVQVPSVDAQVRHLAKPED